ncbi:MAG: SGNH/GDSL hydrolase family protein [Eubacteriales bacterium]
MKKTARSVFLIAMCLLLSVSFSACVTDESVPSDTEGKTVHRQTDESESNDNVTVKEDNKNEPSVKLEYSTYKISDCKDKFKIIGRSSDVADGITCDWSASGISFKAVCQGELSVTLNASAQTYFTVYVDGVRQNKRFSVSSGTQTLELAKDLSDGSHLVTLLKQTENSKSNCVLKSVTLAGTLENRPEDSRLFLEFYGDSITCGYGNLANTVNVSDPGSAIWQDGTASYAFRTAEALNADWSMISVSGIPFSKGYTNFTMGQIMEKTNFKRSDDTYSFERIPSLVIVNLGTNDALNGADPTDVEAKVSQMITTLRAHYGSNQKILFVTGMMNGSCRTQILNAISSAGGVSSGLYEYQCKGSNNSGGNGHPNMQAHINVAAELTTFIQNNILKG